MLVKTLMRSPVATVGPDASLDEVRAAMARDALPELPVVDEDGALMGVVTACNVAAVSVSTLPVLAESECPVAAGRLRVREAMTADTWAVLPEAAIDDVALALAARRRHAVPVVDDRRVVGLVTADQVLAILLRNTPVSRGPRHIVVQIKADDDAAGVIEAAAALVREHRATLTVVHAPRRWPGIEDEPLANAFIADSTHERLSTLLPPDVRGVTRVRLVRGSDTVTAVVDVARREEADLVLADAASARGLIATSPCAVLAIPAMREVQYAHC